MNWRDLKPGETIEPGDEFLNSKGAWVPTVMAGHPFIPERCPGYRRATHSKRLADAAPELLEALETIVVIVRLQNGNLHADINQLLARAEAAIAKATGGAE